jgi:uncharacterized protein (TIGR02246 family)
MSQNPLETIKNLIEAINKGDAEAALSLYEPDAVMVTQRGIARGKDEILIALQRFISLKPTLRGESHQIVNTGNLALYCSKWTLKGTSPDGKHVEMTGVSSDVLRQQPNGQWLVTIDNPWGTSIVV